jgi:hypothetical protein
MSVYVRGPDWQHTVGRQRESGANRHTVQWSEVRVITISGANVTSGVV